MYAKYQCLIRISCRVILFNVYTICRTFRGNVLQVNPNTLQVGISRICCLFHVLQNVTNKLIYNYLQVTI